MGLTMTTEMDKKHDKEKTAPLPAHLLSGEFMHWYGGIIGKDISTSGVHPHFYLNPDFNMDAALSPDKVRTKSTIVESSGSQIQEQLQPLTQINTLEYLGYMPPITSADLIQSSEKISRLLTFDFKSWFVAIEIDDPTTILNNITTLRDISDEFNRTHSSPLQLSTLEHWAVLSDGDQHLLISPFVGQTLEEALKKSEADSKYREMVVKRIKEFALFCESKGIFWRDLAPRNILLPTDYDDRLIFIDYEHLYKIGDLDSMKRRGLEISRRIWFGDILEQGEIDFMFGTTSVYGVGGSTLQKADRLERIFYGRESVTQGEIDNLQQMTAQIERRHMHADTSVYGHRIGRYLTDFVPVDDEAKLYFAFRTLDYETFCRYMFIIQGCIDIDSQKMLSSMYKPAKESLSSTSTFLAEVQHHLGSEKELEDILTKYEGGIR